MIDANTAIEQVGLPTKVVLMLNEVTLIHLGRFSRLQEDCNKLEVNSISSCVPVPITADRRQHCSIGMHDAAREMMNSSDSSTIIS